MTFSIRFWEQASAVHASHEADSYAPVGLGHARCSCHARWLPWLAMMRGCDGRDVRMLTEARERAKRMCVWVGWPKSKCVVVAFCRAIPLSSAVKHNTPSRIHLHRSITPFLFLLLTLTHPVPSTRRPSCPTARDLPATTSTPCPRRPCTSSSVVSTFILFLGAGQEWLHVCVKVAKRCVSARSRVFTSFGPVLVRTFTGAGPS